MALELIDFGPDGSTGRITITNTGNAATQPSLEVTGGMSGGFVLTEVITGAVIRVERVIPEESTIFIDQATGSVTVDNQSPITGNVTRSDWWAVPPGATRVVQFAALGAVTGTPTLTVRYRAANS